MGIHDLYKVLKDQCPNVIQENIPLSTFTGYRIAVDISIFLNKNVKTAGPVDWITSFIQLLCCFKKCGIKPICIFDGPNPPLEKKEEQGRRRGEADKKRRKISELRRIQERLKKENEPNDIPPNPRVCEKIREMMKFSRKVSVDSINFDDIHDVITCLEIYISTLERQNEPIVPMYAAMCKEIISIMGIAYFQASGEAEKLCAELCINGHVDGVLSEDTDVLAYGTHLFLCKINYSRETVSVIFHQDILASLGFTHEQFLDMCILLACDYNKRAKMLAKSKKSKPVSVGCKKVYDLINDYGSIDGALDILVDVDNLKYERCRELFTPSKNIPLVVPYSKNINEKKLAEFLKKHKVKLQYASIIESWKPCKILLQSVTA